jgi:hypothetical protein
MPLLASNFTSNLLYGTTIVAGGWANVNLTVDAFAFEGDKTFAVKLRKDSTLGQVISTSAPIIIKDYTTIVGLSANISTVNEGNLVQFTLTTTNVVNYTNVAYSVFPATANVTADDFVANTGYITIINNVGTFALKANADVSLMDESGENFRVQIRDRNSTNVFISSNITIGDVSRGINVVSFVENASTIAEGGTLTLTFTATNANNVILYYSTDGNATATTFGPSGNTGSFILNGLSNTITLMPNVIPFNTTQNFRVVLRSDTATGPIVATSNTIIALDASIAYMSATGGTVVDSGGYRTHIFTTSGNLTVNTLGISPSYNFIDYLVVGGGASGGRGATAAYYWGGGGGGAGGLLNSNTTLTTTGNTTIIVGAGGSYVTVATASVPGNNGGNSVLSNPGITITAYGGGGGSGFTPAKSGGSGGGTSTSAGVPAGTGTPGQGFPGGINAPVTFGSVGNSNMAGGGGGAGGTGSWNPSDPSGDVNTGSARGGPGLGVPWMPSSYGTPGPSPTARYFAGGGGGGSSPTGSVRLMSGGVGGGGAGAGQPTYPETAYLSQPGTPIGSGGNATINTGGGGGGIQAGGASYPGQTSGSGGSGIVAIRYLYTPQPLFYGIWTAANTYAETANITFGIVIQSANTNTYYYKTVGNVISSDFVQGNTGSFIADTSGNVLTLTVNSNIPAGQTRYFSLQVMEDSLNGLVRATTSNITLVDSLGAYTIATGGNEVVTADGYRSHYFLSSNTFTISTIGTIGPTLEIIAIAGGGGSGSGGYGSGGGGAGGMIWNTSVPVSATGNLVITIGNGGSAPNGSASYLANGGNTRVTAPSAILSANLLAVGGGGGSGYAQNPAGYTRGENGGSGGGGHNLTAPAPAGQGYGYPSPTQQGYPAGDGINGGGTTGGGGGAGGIGGSGPAVSTNPGGPGGIGRAVPWAPASYGTPGPAPGRWFAGGGAGGKEGGPGVAIAGGAGGGGSHNGVTGTIGFAGNVNTGGGGGGHNSPSSGAGIASGGSGIVIIRYPYA